MNVISVIAATHKTLPAKGVVVYIKDRKHKRSLPMNY